MRNTFDVDVFSSSSSSSFRGLGALDDVGCLYWTCMSSLCLRLVVCPRGCVPRVLAGTSGVGQGVHLSH